MRTLHRWFTRLRRLPLGFSFNVHYWGYYPGYGMLPPWATGPAAPRARSLQRGAPLREQRAAPVQDGETELN